jgi:4-hydroxybenzoate polyprenyltransferase
MPSTVFSTPRPVPSRRLPVAGSAMVLALALAIFLVAGWSLRGWAIAALLWAGVHGLDLLVARSGTKPQMQVFAVFFKSVGVLAVLFATVAADRHVALAAAVTYALAYTFELGLSLVAYFGTER